MGETPMPRETPFLNGLVGVAMDAAIRKLPSSEAAASVPARSQQVTDIFFWRDASPLFTMTYGTLGPRR